jgi:hypothetical protein
MFKEVTGRGSGVQEDYFTHEDGSSTLYFFISHPAANLRRAKSTKSENFNHAAAEA